MKINQSDSLFILEMMIVYFGIEWLLENYRLKFWWLLLCQITFSNAWTKWNGHPWRHLFSWRKSPSLQLCDLFVFFPNCWMLCVIWFGLVSIRLYCQYYALEMHVTNIIAILHCDLHEQVHFNLKLPIWREYPKNIWSYWKLRKGEKILHNY